MGVNQYTSAHVFEDLPDGGRIVLETPSDTPGIARIRQHMRDIAAAFRAGDFTKPFQVHAEAVPGSAVMAARRTTIVYQAIDRPFGGEVRIRTTDPAAVTAVHEFLAFQRGAHHAAGHESHSSRGQASTPDSIALADSALRTCRGLPGGGDAQMDCYDAFLDPLVAARGVRTAMGTLSVLGARDPQLRVDGHVYAHAIGITAGRAGGADLSGAFASCTEIFQSGCYHGVIQAYFERVRAVDTASANRLCSSYASPGANQWLRFQCVHGMGHGLMMFYAHNLPRTLSACDLLRVEWDRESCYGCAFMENVVYATAPHHASHMLHSHADSHESGVAPFKALDSTDLQYPCSIVAQRYLVSCYNMQTSVMLYFTHGDIGAAARSCLGAPQSLRPVCYQGLGREISAYSRQVHREAIRLCGLSPAQYQPWCHVGVVKNFIDLTANVGDGIAYCRDLSGSANRLQCYEAVGEEIATLRNDPKEREAACAGVGEAYREACRSGARLPRGRPS